MLDRLSEALTPTWHESRAAGRAVRHTAILRDVAHELSNAPDRKDRPASAAEAQQRFHAYLDDLKATTPRAGIAAPTGAFVDDLIARSSRYGEHLFRCFDDPRIPATTNSLERFFGAVKGTLRRTLGTGSTTSTVVTNLGAAPLIAYQVVRQPDGIEALRAPTATPAQFTAARAEIKRQEAPATKRRSLVRNFRTAIDRIRGWWSRATAP